MPNILDKLKTFNPARIIISGGVLLCYDLTFPREKITLVLAMKAFRPVSNI